MNETAQADEQTVASDAQNESDEPRGLRRILVIFIAVLALAVVGLLVLLFVFVRPEREAGSNAGGAKGYPINLVKAIYGPRSGDSFVQPLGLGFDAEGNLWVSDTGKSRIVVVTPQGKAVRIIAKNKGPGALASPNGIAADPARERMYIADWTAGALLAYSQSGEFLESFPAADQDLDVFGPNGFTPYDVKLVGSNIVAASNNGLYFFDRTGHVIERWGSGIRGAHNRDFNFPNALAVDDANKLIYVADTLNRRVTALDFDGHVRWISGSPDEGGKITGFWQLPRGVAMGPEDVLLVVDTFRFTEDGVGTGHVVALARDGALVSEFGRSGDEEDSFDFPEKIAARPDGLYAMADREHNRIVVFRLRALPAPDDLESRQYEKTVRTPANAEMRHVVPAATTAPASGA